MDESEEGYCIIRVHKSQVAEVEDDCCLVNLGPSEAVMEAFLKAYGHPDKIVSVKKE